jgi:hypothetical protein
MLAVQGRQLVQPHSHEARRNLPCRKSGTGEPRSWSPVPTQPEQGRGGRGSGHANEPEDTLLAVSAVAGEGRGFTLIWTQSDVSLLSTGSEGK